MKSFAGVTLCVRSERTAMTSAGLGPQGSALAGGQLRHEVHGIQRRSEAPRGQLHFYANRP